MKNSPRYKLLSQEAETTMCGRYAISMDTALLKQAVENYDLPVNQVLGQSNQHSSFNVCPTRYAPTYHKQGDESVISYTSWGLIPPWVKRSVDTSQYTTFNARKESIMEGKRIWKLVRSHRCTVPIEGYYEWLNKPVRLLKRTEKVPFYIRRRDKRLMFLAGLYTTSEFEDTKEKVHSFTIITRPASKQLDWIHHRMPVVLEPGTKEWKKWLSNSEWDKSVETCLESYNKDTLEWFEVTKDIGKVDNDGEYLIKPFKKRASDHFFGLDFKKDLKKDLKKEGVKVEDKNDHNEQTFLNDDDTSPKKHIKRKKSPLKKEDRDITSFFSPKKKRAEG